MTDTQIGICKAYGFTIEETAKRISTEKAPAGVSFHTINNRLAAQRSYIAAIAKYVASMRRECEVETVVVSKENVREELEHLLGDAIETLRKALRNGDVRAAEAVLDRAIGKPSQVHKIEGEVNHTHRIWQPERALLQQEQDMLTSGDLLNSLPPDVLEAETL